MKRTQPPDTYEKALLRARKICASKEMTFSDMKHKLKEWNVLETDSAKILQNLLDEKFIDEQRYAMAAVKDKSRFNKWGSYKIKQFLRQKGLQDQVINEALASIDGEDNMVTLEKLMVSKLRSLKDEDNMQKKMKLLRFAQSRGFETDLVMQIIEKLLP